jgi:hypothetical protein
MRDGGGSGFEKQNAVPVFCADPSRVFWSQYMGIRISAKSSGNGGGNAIWKISFKNYQDKQRKEI